MLDPGLSSLIADLDERGLLDETLVVAVGEFGRSPQARRQHFGQQQQRRRPRSLAVLLHGGRRRRRHQARLRLRQVATPPARRRSKTRCTRPTCWRRSTTRVGIDPATIVYNHLNQPRELVKGNVITGIIG